ncbi:MAG: S24/S26 family peptidase [Lachnospiraceae bacterium]|nr:S24/S26 family peptidase [Lachnospiraceae bacterium]
MTKFENEIQKSGYLVFTNEGDSMMPLLREHRDIVVIRRPEDTPKKNDVVLFKRPDGSYALHRIVKCCGLGQYRIVGDNRTKAETVFEEWIIGILTEIIKDGKHLTVESDEYRAYMKKLPFNRFKLRIRTFFGKIGSGLAKLFGRKQK